MKFNDFNQGSFQFVLYLYGDAHHRAHSTPDLEKGWELFICGSAGGQFVLYLYGDAHHRALSTPDPEGDGVFVVSVGRLALKPPHCGQAFCGKNGQPIGRPT